MRALLTLIPLLSLLVLAPLQVVAQTNGDYPPSIADLADEDSADECDLIGWGLTYDEIIATDEITDEQMITKPVCFDPGMTYVFSCAVGDVDELADAPRGAVWVICIGSAINFDREQHFVHTSNFSIVDAEDEVYPYDPGALEGYEEYALKNEYIAGGEHNQFMLGFALPKNFEGPLRLEVQPRPLDVLSPSGLGDTGTIILDPLDKMSETWDLAPSNPNVL